MMTVNKLYFIYYPVFSLHVHIAFDRFDSKKVILKNKNLILIKHLFVKHMERVARMKRQDNKWSTIYLLSSFLVHHKSMNVPKALSNTKSNVHVGYNKWYASEKNERQIPYLRCKNSLKTTSSFSNLHWRRQTSTFCW
jgi:hypothetical protein